MSVYMLRFYPVRGTIKLRHLDICAFCLMVSSVSTLAGYEAPIADNVPRCFRTSIGPINGSGLHTLLTSLARPFQ